MTATNERIAAPLSAGRRICFKRLIGFTAIAVFVLSVISTIIIYNVVANTTLSSYSGTQRIGATAGLLLVSFVGSYVVGALLSVLFLWQARHTRLLRAKLITTRKRITKVDAEHKTPWRKLIFWTLGIDACLQVVMIIFAIAINNQESSNVIYGVMAMDLIGTIVSLPIDLAVVFTAYKIKEWLTARKQQKAKTTKQEH